ncbi:hypothetical protein Sste5346_000407 [Sporothrix stenoceras]|uniref:Uncharacterized protein n=1 Tax=Sporothrix stenoceras TaxID=5173 RepID=A0ABR3ZR18_9PEZI
MTSYPTAEDEKRLLAHAAETTTTTIAADNQKSQCKHACRRRVAKAKKVVHFTVTLAFVFACCIAVFGLGSLAIGTIRAARPCNKHTGAHGKAGSHHKNGAAVVVAEGAVPTGSSFSRLLEAVSPESLHDLLHEYLPDTYKHGVYPSEKHALEAIHRENAALATSIIQLARRDLNSTTSSSSPSSNTPSSTTSSTTSLPATSTFKNTSTTSHITSKTTSSSSEKTTSSGKKTTNIYTSTVNGTPTVVTATSVVGVSAANTGGTATNGGTLQTGAAAPLAAAGNNARFAVAGVLVGAMLI